jgi:hypothetical protein
MEEDTAENAGVVLRTVLARQKARVRSEGLTPYIMNEVPHIIFMSR